MANPLAPGFKGGPLMQQLTNRAMSGSSQSGLKMLGPKSIPKLPDPLPKLRPPVVRPKRFNIRRPSMPMQKIL